jgi:hypothetical protein
VAIAAYLSASEHFLYSNHVRTNNSNHVRTQSHTHYVARQCTAHCNQAHSQAHILTNPLTSAQTDTTTTMQRKPTHERTYSHTHDVARTNIPTTPHCCPLQAFTAQSHLDRRQFPLWRYVDISLLRSACEDFNTHHSINLWGQLCTGVANSNALVIPRFVMIHIYSVFLMLTRTHTHTHARARAHTHTHTHARAHTHTHTHAHTHTHTHTHTHRSLPMSYAP